MVVLAVFCSVGQVSDLGCIFIVVQLIRFFSLPEFGEELIFVRSMWAVNYAHAYWFLPTSKIVVRISSITSKNIYSGFIVGRLNIFQYFHCLNYRRQLCCILGIRTKNNVFRMLLICKGFLDSYVTQSRRPTEDPLNNATNKRGRIILSRKFLPI